MQPVVALGSKLFLYNEQKWSYLILKNVICIPRITALLVILALGALLLEAGRLTDMDDIITEDVTKYPIFCVPGRIKVSMNFVVVDFRASVGN